MKVKLVCISDTHTMHSQIKIPEGDIILHAGDVSYKGTKAEIKEFLEWYEQLNFKHKILIAGNHDWGFEESPNFFEAMCKGYGIKYLKDSGVKLEGIKFWGSPVQPAFCDWAFNRARNEFTANNEFAVTDNGINMDYGYDLIKPHWDMIPDDTDVLITHGPPHGILDQTVRGKLNVGCEDLLEAVYRVKPKLHVFGHIHEVKGRKEYDGITFINASSVDLRYNPYPQEAEVYEIEV